MAIRFQCPSCSGDVQTGDEWAGKGGICPTCKERIRIPIVDAVPHQTASEWPNLDLTGVPNSIPSTSLPPTAVRSPTSHSITITAVNLTFGNVFWLTVQCMGAALLISMFLWCLLMALMAFLGTLSWIASKH